MWFRLVRNGTNRYCKVINNIKQCYMTTISEHYMQQINNDVIKSDERQLEVIKRLDDLQARLKLYTPNVNNVKYDSGNNNNKTISRWSSWFSSSSSSNNNNNSNNNSNKFDNNIPQGIYLHGSPGCGKSYLMDMFYDIVEFEPKRRVHFNKFMLTCHDRIHKTRQQQPNEDPIMKLAHIIYNESTLLCFDEFQVLDIADAMTIRRLFERLWKLGVVVVATSNRPPYDLYKNGLQRELFVPFIDDLRKNCEIVDMDSMVDYRSLGTRLSNTYFSKANNPNALDDFKNAWEKVTKSRTPETVHIKVMQGRTMLVPIASYGCAWFKFSDLCMEAVGPADYIALTENFHTIFIQDIPALHFERRNEIRRFINLIDELYQAHIRVVICADVSVQQLLVPSKSAIHDEIFAFERCISRLIEMQSKEYLDQANLLRQKKKLPLVNVH